MNYARRALIAMLVGGAFGPAWAQMLAPPMLVQNVTVIDGTGKVLQNVSIRILAGKIKEIGPNLTPAPREKVVDERGKFVIPGLIDTRVQLGLSPANQLFRAEVGAEQRTEWLHTMLRLGITTARIFQGDLSEQRYFKHFRDMDLLNSPTLVISGPTFTAPNGSPGNQYGPLASALRQREVAEVAGEDEAREKSRVVAHNEADVFEIVYAAGPQVSSAPRLADDALAVITKEAHGHELKTFCWVGTNAEAKKAIVNGCDVIEGVSEELLSDELLKEMAGKKIPFLPALLYQGHLVQRIADAAELKAYLADSRVANNLSPLMKKSLEADRGQVADLRKLLPVRAGASEEEVQAAMMAKPDARPKGESAPGESRHGEDKPEQPTVADMFREQAKRAALNVQRAKAAGVKVIVGTGAGSVLDFPGSSVHLEMELLVKSGLTPAEALDAATRNAALSLGKDGDVGTIEVNKDADFVILEANPLTDIRNTSKVKAVVRRGRLVQPDDLSNY